MGTTMVQMNTRIPADLKEQGDLALAQAGYTPSQAVRALWEFAAEHVHDPKAVRTMLDEEDAEVLSPAAQERLKAFESGTKIFDDLYAKLGIDPNRPASRLDYRELRDLYYEERLERE